VEKISDPNGFYMASNFNEFAVLQIRTKKLSKPRSFLVYIFQSVSLEKKRHTLICVNLVIKWKNLSTLRINLTHIQSLNIL
jgi:hypothetical protein